MTRTENLNLPQWEATDPIRREDFNGAFAAIDVAKGGVECVSVDTLGYTDGDTVYTFEMKPKCVLLWGVFTGGMLIQDGVIKITDYYEYTENYYGIFHLDGTALVMAERTDPRVAEILTIVALY